jgi:hypothetical protein
MQIPLILRDRQDRYFRADVSSHYTRAHTMCWTRFCREGCELRFLHGLEGGSHLRGVAFRLKSFRFESRNWAPFLPREPGGGDMV